MKIEGPTAQFEEQRSRLRAIAYRMLGSFSDADDAVQETWLRLDRTATDDIENLPGWLTTVLTRICLNMLEARRLRHEEALAEPQSEPTVHVASLDPEHEAVVADSVGLALQVVLQTLSPSERVAFVLHDLFSVPFDDIARVLRRSSVAVRQLASRARRRVQDRPVPDRDFVRQWDVVAAFYAAAREGDLEGLLKVLDPEVVLRLDGGGGAPHTTIRGARDVARRASAGAQSGRQVRLALVNGAPGATVLEFGRLVSVASFTVIDGMIVEIEMLRDPERLSRL